ncbi:hypothetical protein OC845_004503 [Tilletia horrida]|nr:hypothetical protein OC845_004503 [Tilletia horrida]
MDTLRVDGNDVFAVRAAVAGAKQRILSNSRPILLDDDSSAYRSKDRVEDWKRLDNPLHRMRNFLHERSWWSDEEEEAIKKQHRADLLRAINRAEKRMRPSITSMFEDVYQGQMPQSLQDQRAELARLIKKYGQHEPWAKEIAKHRQQGADLEAFLPKDQ